MSIEELQKAVEEMKAQGQSEEEIAGAYYLLFRDGKIDLEQLEALVNNLGFELSEEFKAMDPEMQKEAGYQVLDEEQNAPEQPSEPAEKSEEDEAMKFFEGNKKEEKEETSEPEDKKEEENKDEEDEEKKAMKFFR